MLYITKMVLLLLHKHVIIVKMTYLWVLVKQNKLDKMHTCILILYFYTYT